MRVVFAFVLVLTVVPCAFGQNHESNDRGKREEESSCIQCHSLRLVDSQRLSPAAWQKEVDKMIGWGAPVSERQALIDYLAGEYGVNKPMPAQQLTADGVSAGTQQRR